MNHIEKALKKAQHYESIGDKTLADKFFKIAERYEYLIDQQRKKDEEEKQKNLYS